MNSLIYFGTKTSINKKRKRKTKHKHHQTLEQSQSAEFVGNNQDLLSVIFSKLRKKYRSRCKIICKNWYQIITGHKFIPKLPPPSHLLIQRYTSKNQLTFYPTIKYWTVPLNNGTVGGNGPPTPTPSVSQPPFMQFLESNINQLHTKGISISQSCNGLYLCPFYIPSTHRETCTLKNRAAYEYYVYNPTTNESRRIRLPSKDKNRQVTVMNLAFDPSISPTYKIVSLSRVHNDYISYNQVHIYSSETKSWSLSKAVFPNDCAHVDFGIGVFLNGSIHWPSTTGETSFYFDVEQECFKIMPMPITQDCTNDNDRKRNIRYFGEAGGTLLLIDFHEAFDMKFAVFGMENDYSKWFVKYKVDLRKFRRVREKLYILSVICEENEEGLSLVIYVPGRGRSGYKGLMAYDLNKRKLKQLYSPVTAWDLKLLEEKGFTVVHPLIRTRYAV